MIQTPSILITDDDEQFRTTVRSVLEPEGYHTIVAGSGEEAVEIVRSERIHVVLLDMHMPKLTGLETLRLVKRFDAVLPCILLSAAMDELIRSEAEEARAFAVLSKPVSRFDLTNSVHEALTRTYGWG